MRLAIDIAMLVFYVFAMAYAWTGNRVHEIIGVLLGALVFAHGFLNFPWFRNYLGRPGLQRTLCVRNLLNAALTLIFLGSLITGILHSQALFAFWPWEGSVLLRQWHVALSYWFLVFAAIHVGLHWHVLARKILPAGGWKSKLGWMFALMLSAWGIKAFIDQEIYYKLILYYAFSFPDGKTSGLMILRDHVLMLFPFAVVSYSLNCKPRKTHD